MKSINLTNGKSAIVDDEDYEWASKHKWQYDAHNGYAIRGHRQNGKRTTRKMHREIMKADVGIEVDHINGDKLDNRKSNLRLCGRSSNMANMKLKINNQSGYKGVSWSSRGNKWQVHIMVDNKSIYLGMYSDKEEAARAYDNAARKYFGEFAKTNFEE